MLASASPTLSVPRANASCSKKPSGPFHTTVRAPRRRATNCSIVRGPISSPMRSGAMVSTVSAVPAARGLGHQLGRELQFVILDPRTSDLNTARAHEGVGHGTADQDSVNPGQQITDNADFVGDLGAAENRDIRPCRIVGQRAERL